MNHFRVDLFTILLAFSLLSVHAALADTFTAPAPNMVLSTLRTAHPRLLLTDERLAELKRQAASDPFLSSGVQTDITAADALVKVPATTTSDGQILMDHYVTLGLAWRWTHNPAYRDAALQLIKQENTLSTWGSGLQCAMMTSATAVGYDWFYSDMDAATRAQMRAQITQIGINGALTAYGGLDGKGSHEWWIRTPYNWNSVCNGSLILGLLAVADDDRPLVSRFLPQVVNNLRITIDAYNPDGVWDEGTMYWTYGSIYLTYALASLTSALGTDFGLSENAPGLEKTGDWILYARSPSGLYATFADSHPHFWDDQRIALSWLARRYNIPYLTYEEFNLYKAQVRTQPPPSDPGQWDSLYDGQARWNPFDIIWYPAPKNTPPPAPPLPDDKFFAGRVPMFFTRGNQEGRNALWSYIKGGDNAVNHAHRDLGSFELDALGQRWVCDLGGDDYSIPGYFTDPKRFDDIYRLSAFSQNVPIVNGANQPGNATSAFVSYSSDKNGAAGVVDLAKAYPMATSALRGLESIDGRRAVLVQDEFHFAAPSDYVWGVMTAAHVTLIKGGAEAVLENAGHEMHVRILSPSGAVFQLASAYAPPPQNPNKGITRLEIALPKQQNVSLAVLFSPIWSDGEVTTAVVKPLSSWPGKMPMPK